MSGGVWDPFEGEVGFLAPSEAALASVSRGRLVLGALGVPVVLAGFALMLVEWILFPDVLIAGFPVIGAGVASVGFAMVLLTANEDAAGRGLGRVAAGIAQAKEWSFQPVRQRTRRSGSADGLGGRIVSDPAMAAAYDALGPVLLQGALPINPQAILRGQVAGQDLWIGLEEIGATNRPGGGLIGGLWAAATGGAVAVRAVIGVRAETQGALAVDLAMPIRRVAGDGPELGRLQTDPALSGPLLDLGAERMVVRPGAVFVSFPAVETVEDARAWLDTRLTAVGRVAGGLVR